MRLLEHLELLISTAFGGEIILWKTSGRRHSVISRLKLPGRHLIYIKSPKESNDVYFLDMSQKQIIQFDPDSLEVTREFDGFFGFYRLDCFDIYGDKRLVVGIDNDDYTHLRLAQMAHSVAYTFECHSHYITSVKVMNSTKMVWTCSADMSICGFSLSSMIVVTRFRNMHSHAINQIKYFGDGVFVTCSKKGTVKTLKLKLKQTEQLQEFNQKQTYYLHSNSQAGFLVLAGHQNNAWIIWTRRAHQQRPEINEQAGPTHKHSHGLNRPPAQQRLQVQTEIDKLQQKVALKRETLELLRKKKQNLLANQALLEKEVLEILANSTTSIGQAKSGLTGKQQRLEKATDDLKKHIARQKGQICDLKKGIRELEQPESSHEIYERYKKVRAKYKAKKQLLHDLRQKLKDLSKKCKKRKKKNQELKSELTELNQLCKNRFLG